MAIGCDGVPRSKLAIAFACVIGAAFASVLGALFVIVLPVNNKLFLASSLSFAAGVMLYVSFVDIYAGKSVGHFNNAGYSPADAFVYSTICFFGGFPISWGLDYLAERLVYREAASKAASPNPRDQGKNISYESSTMSKSMSPTVSKVDVDVESSVRDVGEESSRDISRMTGRTDNCEITQELSRKKLVHMGLLAALAMALHNMPEGLVTFVGYMDSVRSGITTALAIAIHNIPEGMVITSAVYFGTNQRFKAVLWTVVAALAEPLGGLIGLAVVCGGSLTDTVFGIMFGLVAGIMTYISLKELLPGARSLDPKDRVTTTSMTAGMIVMACSLMAIAFSQPVDDEEAEQQ